MGEMIKTIKSTKVLAVDKADMKMMIEQNIAFVSEIADHLLQELNKHSNYTHCLYKYGASTVFVYITKCKKLNKTLLSKHQQGKELNHI